MRKRKHFSKDQGVRVNKVGQKKQDDNGDLRRPPFDHQKTSGSLNKNRGAETAQVSETQSRDDAKLVPGASNDPEQRHLFNQPGVNGLHDETIGAHTEQDGRSRGPAEKFSVGSFS